jgi:RNA polymerase sigma-70 factor (ECF subfamily)
VVWRRFESVPDGDEAVLWLYGIAFNQLRNVRRSNRRQTRLAARILPVASMPDSAEPSDVPVETIRAALGALTFDDREVIESPRESWRAILLRGLFHDQYPILTRGS